MGWRYGDRGVDVVDVKHVVTWRRTWNVDNKVNNSA